MAKTAKKAANILAILSRLVILGVIAAVIWPFTQAFRTRNGNGVKHRGSSYVNPPSAFWPFKLKTYKSGGTPLFESVWATTS